MKILTIILIFSVLLGCSPNYHTSRGEEQITIIVDSMRNTIVTIKHKGKIDVQLKDVDTTYLWKKK